MRWDGIYLNAAAAFFDGWQTVEDAVAAGLYDPDEATTSWQRSVSVSRGLSGPELAVAAGRRALDCGDRPSTEVGLVIHASCWFQGLDIWNVASYVQHEVIGDREAFAFELRQLSNGGMSALELAAGQLTVRPELDAALVTTGDRFAEPGFPRWTADSGLVFGDAGTAALLSRRPRGFRLVATAGFTDPALEGQHRGNEPFRPCASDAGVLDLVARRKDFFERMPAAEVMARCGEGMRTAVKRCVADAGTDLTEIAMIVLPFFGTQLATWVCFDPLGIAPDRTLHEWGLQVGHLGAGDQLAGLARLIEQDRLAAGDRVLLVGVGAGFVWSAAVLEKL